MGIYLFDEGMKLQTGFKKLQRGGFEMCLFVKDVDEAREVDL